jgi:hypothetical protein
MLRGSMPAWLSPFNLPAEHQTALSQAGWERWNGTVGTLPSSGVLLYDTPDRLLALGIDALQTGYEQLQAAELASRAVALWRLLHDSSTHGPEPEPLAGAITLALLSASPRLLDAYLDLELKADLRGGEPDVAYQRRLLSALNPTDLISAWQALHDPRELQEAREEAELTLLQLHQVQEELEHYFLLSRGQHHQLDRYSQLQQRSQRLLAKLAQASSSPSII